MTTPTSTNPEELYKLQSEINTYVAQKEELYKLLKDTQTGYDIDTSSLGYQFKPATNLSAQAKQTENLAKYQALKAYFVKNYNENTKMRNYYFKEVDKLNVVLNEQASEMTELATAYDSLTTQASTDYRRLKTEKYMLAEQDYYYNLYLVCGIVQLVVLIVLGLAWNDTIPHMTGLMIMVLALLGLTVYIVYYVFFKSDERDPVTFDKFRYPIKPDTIISAKTGNKTDTERKRDKEVTDKVAELLSTAPGQCPTPTSASN
jgi:hypothetical protein